MRCHYTKSTYHSIDNEKKLQNKCFRNYDKHHFNKNSKMHYSFHVFLIFFFYLKSLLQNFILIRFFTNIF